MDNDCQTKDFQLYHFESASQKLPLTKALPGKYVFLVFRCFSNNKYGEDHSDTSDWKSNIITKPATLLCLEV